MDGMSHVTYNKHLRTLLRQQLLQVKEFGKSESVCVCEVYKEMNSSSNGDTIIDICVSYDGL